MTQADLWVREVLTSEL